MTIICDINNIVADLDECEFRRYSCDINAECKNTIGSYECQCRDGYHGNGRICNGSVSYKYNTALSITCLTSDIDECATGLNSCPEGSNCRNLVGGHSCGVPPDIERRNPGLK